MVDLAGQYARIKSEIDAAISEVLHTTSFIQGPEVKEFETKLADYTGSAHMISCANGTDALQLAMMALGLKPGDEVILPAHTYVATAEVIALLGLTPVFIDVKEDTFTLDAEQLESKITSRTRAIVPVHLYGQCADMAPILDIAARHKLYVIEDAAQSLGAEYTFPDGVRTSSGAMGHIGATSFFPSKNLGCFGDGGALFTQDAGLADLLRRMANHGQSVKYVHDIIGVNSRLDTLQAAVLTVKLKYLKDYESNRRKAAAYYDKALDGLEWLIRPARSTASTHVFHQYTLRVLNGKRDVLKEYLHGRGIPTMIYYPIPLHMQKAYKSYVRGSDSFPVSERLSKEVLSIPIHTELTEDQLSYICEVISAFPA
jgi:dTDP-4-amino-4,6-dideoxygalactose transaminase